MKQMRKRLYYQHRRGGALPINNSDIEPDVGSVGGKNATLANYADVSTARTTDKPAVLSGRSLTVDNTATSDRVTIADLAIGTTHTLSWWMKTSADLCMVFGQSNGFGAVYFDSNLLVYRDSALNSAFVPYVLDLAAWHHFAVVRTPATVKFYVDGVQIDTDKAIAGATGWSVANLVGPSYGIGTMGFVDDHRIYLATALTEGQLAELVAGGSVTGVSSSHRWTFN